MAEFGESRIGQILSGLGRLVGLFGGSAKSGYLRAFEGLRSALLETGDPRPLLKGDMPRPELQSLLRVID